VQLPNLHFLDLSYNPVANGGLSELTRLQLPRLRWLLLSGCKINHLGLSSLVKCSWFRHLEWLDLSSNQIGIEGIRLLVDHLPAAPQLRGNLSTNPLSSAGRKLLARCPQIWRDP
jgi:Leucine-rich repeat (LRR) protein